VIKIALRYTDAQMSARSAKTQREKPQTVRLPMPLYKRLKKIADRNHLSVADIIRFALAEAIPVIERDGLTIRPV
jgi:predicted DNA-binding ribbon-helix-helix protein